MALVGDRTFVGFGFGPIQAGLFLYEAFHAGTFRRLVVAEVMPEVVAALRRAKGLFSVNIAHSNRVEAATVGPVEPEDPADPARADVVADTTRRVGAAGAGVSWPSDPTVPSTRRGGT